MKAIKKKLSTVKGPNIHLLSSSPESPTYMSTWVEHTRDYSTDEFPASDRNSNQGSDFSLDFKPDRQLAPRSPKVNRPHPPRSPKVNAPPAPILEPNPAYKAAKKWIRNAKQQSDKEPVFNPTDVKFRTVTVTNEGSYLAGMWQSTLVIFLFVCMPSVLFAFTGSIFLRCVVIQKLGRSVPEKRKLRYAIAGLVAGIFISLFKDSTIAMTVIYSMFEVRVSLYEVLYTIVVFFSLLLFAVLPIMVFEFCERHFSYSAISADSPAASPSKAGKLAENFMRDNLNSLHLVNSLKEQFTHLKNRVPTKAAVLITFAAAVISVTRSVTPWLIVTSHNAAVNRMANGTINNTANHKISNPMTVEADLAANDTVLVLSPLNSMVMSILLCGVFAATVAWQSVMMNTWKRFSSYTTETDSLISAGSDGIEAWWRIYQTTRFLTWSSETPAGFLRHFMLIYFMMASAVLSAVLLTHGSITGGTQKVTVSLMVIDNALLTASIGVSFVVSVLTSNIQNGLVKRLSLLKLNMAHEAGKYAVTANGDQQRCEGEFHAHLKKFKDRNLRAALQVLQEMIPVIRDLESNAMDQIYNITSLVIILLGVASSALGMKKLLNT